MARKIVKIPDPSTLTFTSNDPPSPPCGPWGWQTEEFDCDQDSHFFVRVHWTVQKRKHFVQYFHRSLHGSSPTLRELIDRLRKIHGD